MDAKMKYLKAQVPNCIRYSPFSSPLAATRSRTGAKIFMTTLPIKMEKKADTTATGTARAMAASWSMPLVTVKATASTVAEAGSAEMAPPMLMAPIKIASKDAPMMMPVVTSPSKMPAIRPTIMGRSIMHWPISQLPP